MRGCVRTAIVGTGAALALMMSVQAADAQLIISEFRLRGLNPNGATNEYVEIYNNSGADHTVAGGGTGYAVAASDGVARCVIPNGTVIPNRGHYLCTNSVGYGLSGNATGNATFTTDIPDNTGIALFNTSVGVDFTLANRLDAVGFTSEANTLYKEGTGIATINPTFNIDHSFIRDTCGKGGSITTAGNCPTGGLPKDTDNNAADFYFVDSNGTSAGAGQRLGAPGPENLASPTVKDVAQMPGANIDPTVAISQSPNRVRDYTPGSGSTSSSGTLSIRRTFTNNTGAPITRLRFRIIDLTTFPAPTGTADLRPITSTTSVVSITGGSVTVQGLTLETPPSQPNGGGFNSTFSAGTVTTGAPLANGGTISVNFLMGVQQAGAFRLLVNIETNP